MSKTTTPTIGRTAIVQHSSQSYMPVLAGTITAIRDGGHLVDLVGDDFPGGKITAIRNWGAHFEPVYWWEGQPRVLLRVRGLWRGRAGMRGPGVNLLFKVFGAWYRTGVWTNGMPWDVPFLTRNGALRDAATDPKGSVYDLYLRGPVVFVPGKAFRRGNRTV
jgi:hypothetical protein